MPSSPPSSDSETRRAFLATFGTVTGAALAGCAGRLPGTDPKGVDARRTTEAGEISWEYPPNDDADGIGYASVELDRNRTGERSPSAYRLTLNSTVRGSHGSEQYEGYRADWFRFRVGPPAAYAARYGFEMRVQPPPWPELSLRYDRRGGRRALVVESEQFGSDGTITFDLLFVPGGSPAPQRLHCSFEVQASRGGALAKTVSADGQGTLAIPSDSG
ncbi:hypothetical protein C475_03439 [Halosimplex carlsbadense 2-9-1]|uniref:DUF8121 domain-containing protein n=1 Tax=Halosimplex carlsbadense 2-9-1 TaxID=797114 RepID=M0D306_9EURY|nr:hypothetical protein [Halosimplex carlsbadense]ELZ29238.1 hypothetical protein C475_03439 [Halosimplex carlsbadense 2-9-1]